MGGGRGEKCRRSGGLSESYGREKGEGEEIRDVNVVMYCID